MITIKFNKDFRNFKEGQEISFEPTKRGITYIAGGNGSGKSTLTRIIRLQNDSLGKQRLSDADGLVNQKLTTVRMELPNIEVSGLDKYSHIFSLDAEVDNPLDFQNAATAYGLIAGGGLQMQRISRGQGAAMMFVRFIKNIEDEFKKVLEPNDKHFNWRPLVIIDEVDEGLDIGLQFKWNTILINKFNIMNCDVLVISHNAMCMLSPGNDIQVYDIEDNEMSAPADYFKKKTGATITIGQ